MHLIEGQLKAELLRITQLRAPAEAVGLILPNGEVKELRNKAESHTTFEVDRRDVIRALDDLDDISGVTMWHSHPGGGVGPSRTDMQQKTPFENHLVVSLVDGELIPTWY